MRICIVTREYPEVTAYSGGIGTSFAVLAEELARQGHEPHVLTVSPNGSPGEMSRDGIRFHMLKRPVNHRLHFLEESVWTFSVDRALDKLGPFDVIVAAEWGGDMARYARHKRQGPVVILLTSSLPQLLEINPGVEYTKRWRLRYALQGPLERKQTERADGILGLTKAITDWARELWDIEDVYTELLPNLVPVESVRRIGEGSELPEGWPSEGPIVAFQGRLEPRKGPHVLAKAMNRVWERFPTAKLVTLGRDSPYKGGWMSDHMKQSIGENADKLLLLGSQPRELLLPALKAADVVALPSLWENFANAAMEALALGCPLVATTGSGYQEFISSGEDGLLVPPDDPDALGDAIVRVLADDELRARLSENAAKNVERLDVPVVTRQYVEFFERVAR